MTASVVTEQPSSCNKSGIEPRVVGCSMHNQAKILFDHESIDGAHKLAVPVSQQREFRCVDETARSKITYPLCKLPAAYNIAVLS